MLALPPVCIGSTTQEIPDIATDVVDRMAMAILHVRKGLLVPLWIGYTCLHIKQKLVCSYVLSLFREHVLGAPIFKVQTFLYKGKRTDIFWEDAGINLHFPAAYCVEPIKITVAVPNEKH